jgi:hypothetical protein
MLTPDDLDVPGSLRNWLGRSWHGLLYPSLCGAAVLACVLLARPFANGAFNDDWAYAHVALKFAKFGQIHYDGCCSAMVLFQSLWGAAWIRLFGFSFDLLRIVTLPFSIGFVLLVYALARKAGLEKNLAFFGTLVIATSPLFFPLAASFMTEPYACFFTVLCVYAAICSAEAASSGSATRWLWILAASGILGGSDRQTVWGAPVALIPHLIWIRRLDRRFCFHAAASYGMCISCLAFMVVRFNQPYAPVRSPQQFFELVVHNSPTAVTYLVSLLLAGCLISLPALFCAVPIWKRLGLVRMIVFAAVAAVLTYVFVSGLGRLGLAPFVGNILSPVGVLGLGTDALGFRPALFLILRVGLTWLVILSVIAAGSLYKILVRWPARVPWAVFTIFLCAYIPFLYPGALLGWTFDRNLLPIFPVMVISILLPLRSHVRRAPIAAWVCLHIFAGYSIATTHDYFSALRARVLAAEALEKRGISRVRISAGLEYDAWTQLEVAGRPMAGAWYGDSTKGNSTNTFWFWSLTKAVQPDYVTFYSRVSEPQRHELLSIPFTDWIPPFRRMVVISKRADLGR